MGTRKLRAKKYKSIYEYYRDSDPDKKTIAHYISYWMEIPGHKNKGTTKKERVHTLDPKEALKILNERKAESAQKKLDRENLKENGHDYTIDHVATEYFKERKKINNIHKDMGRYILHIGDRIYETKDTKSSKGYELLQDAKEFTVAPHNRRYETKHYQRDISDTTMNIGNILIADLDPNILRQLINAIEKKGHSSKTIASIMNLLKAITNHGISEGYIVRNPFLNKKAKVEVPKEDRKRLFTPQERKEIFIEAKQMDNRLFMLFKMLYYTGQRPHSIIKLRVKDIDLNQRQISIDAIKDQSGTYAPISDKLYPLLSLWVKGCDMDQRLFDIEYATFRTKTSKLFEKYNKGLDYKTDRYRWASMYTFRHTAATVMLAKTNNIKTVQTVLNHSDPKVTAIYAKLLNDAKMEGVNVL